MKAKRILWSIFFGQSVEDSSVKVKNNCIVKHDISKLKYINSIAHPRSLDKQ